MEANQRGAMQAKLFQLIRKKALPDTITLLKFNVVEIIPFLVGIALGIVLWINTQQPKE